MNRSILAAAKTIGFGGVLAAFIFTIAVVYNLQKSSRISDVQLVEKKESLYNDIFIYKDATGRVHLTFGYRGRNFTESMHNPNDLLELPVVYTRFMTVGLAYTAETKQMLFIGMGGGSTSAYLEAFVPQLQITEVELDPEVVSLAEKYFDFKPTDQLKVAVEDGRKYLMSSDGHYDLIMLDAYRGPFVPFHLLTVNFYQEVKKHLKPGGVVVQNIEPTTMLFDSAVATMRKVFDQVEFYNAEGNVIAIAYDGNQRSKEELLKNASLLQSKYNFRYALPEMLSKRKFYTPKADVEPLTDDFAPVDSLKSIASHNRKWE